jgi:hypothetical protein
MDSYPAGAVTGSAEACPGAEYAAQSQAFAHNAIAIPPQMVYSSGSRTLS